VRGVPPPRDAGRGALPRCTSRICVLHRTGFTCAPMEMRQGQFGVITAVISIVWATESGQFCPSRRSDPLPAHPPTADSPPAHYTSARRPHRESTIACNGTNRPNHVLAITEIRVQLLTTLHHTTPHRTTCTTHTTIPHAPHAPHNTTPTPPHTPPHHTTHTTRPPMCKSVDAVTVPLRARCSRCLAYAVGPAEARLVWYACVGVCTRTNRSRCPPGTSRQSLWR
jgi:hypothetical protein